ncbi:MAG TPA: hypothetical protein VF263_19310 [Longimicrobiaceae bacterium]
MTTHRSTLLRGEEGAALVLVLLIVMAVGALSLGALAVSGNAGLITAYQERQSEMEAVAEAGLEEARARINGDPALYPDSGYATLENGVQVRDAAGTVIPGIRRYTYAGPTGVATGQFGVFGSVVVVAEDENGDRVIRRADIVQESFSKFAYFTDVEPANIAFGSGDQIQGPVHTNDVLKIYNTRATFRGPGMVTTARTIDGKQYGTFLEGFQEGAARIAMPTTVDLNKLRGYAVAGGTAFNAPAGGNADEARMRIEFLSIPVAGRQEGFFRVYQSNQADWVMAIMPGVGWPSSDNCGAWNDAGTAFFTSRGLPGNPSAADRRAWLRRPSRRCFLGGDERLNAGGAFDGDDGRGQWVARPSAWPNPPAEIAARPDRDFLFPLNRDYNVNFKGVIHVTGRVAISGTVRGRVTLATTGSIFIVDDLRYQTDPAVGTCEDILGLFGGGDIVVADNTVNAPQQVDNNGAHLTFDDTPNEFVHSVVLTLNNFTVQDFDEGPTDAERCEGVGRGRGCLYLTGGIIQRERGAVGTTAGHGYLKRYSYDGCAYSSPPPYYPTTGRFGRGRYFEVEPAGFAVRDYFDRITAGN